MPSYKIHSLKDSNKLSFIIEWESETSVQQKLSSEGYIVLSVEKTEVNEEKIFIFEWRKPDKSFIEWKIQAEDIFIAYDMLSKEYGYSISKLYPSNITDKTEQEKIFQELLCTFDEKKTIVTKKNNNTSSRALEKNKIIIEKLKTIVTNNITNNKEEILSDLKKLDLTNNNSTIKLSLKTIVKDLAMKYRTRKDIYALIKPLVAETGVFMPPDIYFSFLERLQWLFSFFGPLLHPSDSYVSTKSQSTSASVKNHDQFKSIQKNNHINTLLQKKYGNKGLIHSMTIGSSQAYFYTLYRCRNFFLLSKIGASFLVKILRTSIIIAVLCLLIFVLLDMHNTVFVTSSILSAFVFIILLTLVIPAETV